MITKKCLTCGKHFNIEPYRKDTAKYCSQVCMGNDKNSNWAKSRFKNGHKNLLIAKSDKRNSILWNKWRKSVFERDNYICQECGEIRLQKLVPHHIKSYDEYPELRLLVSNGITLCSSCHLKKHPEIIEIARKNNLGKKHTKSHKRKISIGLEKSWKKRKFNK